MSNVKKVENTGKFRYVLLNISRTSANIAIVLYMFYEVFFTGNPKNAKLGSIDHMVRRYVTSKLIFLRKSFKQVMS